MGKIAGLNRTKLFQYGLIFGLFSLLLLATAAKTYAAAGINSQVNFQGRLYTAAGATVPDGYYNLEFKIYQDGDGQTAGDTTGTPAGSLKWTEDYLGQAGNGVLVKNGFLSVQLGSINAFGSQVDWNQNTLWLSMNVAGTSTSCATFSACTPDGEMTPMKRMSANAYALNAGLLGGLSATGFIQNTTTPQTASNFNITGTGIAGTALQAPLVDTATATALGIGTTNATAINLNKLTTITNATNGSALLITQSVSPASGSALLYANLTAASPTGNLADLRTGGASKFTISVAGDTTVGGNLTVTSGVTALNGAAAGSSNALSVVTGAASNTGATIKGAASQTADLLRYQSANGETLSKVDANGSTTSYGTTTNILNLSAPVISSTSTATTGGTLAAATYWYVVTSTNANGETVASTSSSRATTGSASTVTVNWSQVPGAVGYKVYRNTSNVFTAGNLLLATIGNGTTTSLVDSGTATSAGLPPTTNTISGLIVQQWKGLSGPLVNLQDSAGTSIVRLGGSSGDVLALGTGSFGAGSGLGAQLNVKTTNTTSVGTIIRGMTSQSADLLQLQDVNGYVSGSINNLGNQLTLGNATALGTSQGILRVSDGSSDGFFANVKLGGVIAADQTYLLPTSGGTFAMTNDATNFIRNQNASAQATSNFWISGFGTAQTLQAATFDTPAGTTTLAVGTTNATAINLNQNTTVASGKTLSVGGDINTTTQYKIGGTTTLTSSAVTFSAASAASISAAAAQNLNIQGGSAVSGNTNGGNLTLSGGAGSGSGAAGLVIFTTPTFSTAASDANCYAGGALVASSCTISSASVNGSSAIIVGFSASGLTASLPSPGITTAGRVVYLTAANGSSDFTLAVNGGGTGNQIAMRQNTTATMIWNGSAWTAAGASSSTTLQSAYDNTLQSAGGAELVVSKTGNTNGLTIRDSTTAPVNGTLLTVQTASAAGLFSVNSNVTEYASNGGAETQGASASTFPASTWGAVGSAGVSRFTTAGNFIATGKASVQTTTTALANDGVSNALTSALTANLTYNVSFSARLSSGTFTDMNVYYSINGSAASVACSASQAIATSVWTKVNCAFAAPASGITSSNAILIRQTGAVAKTFYVENLSVTIAANYNYATDGGVDDATNFATNWSAVSGATVSRDTTVGNDASDSTKVVTTATAGMGVRNKLAINPLVSTLYRVTIYAASTTTGFNDFTARYSRDGGTSFTACADYNTQAVSSSTGSFTKITCYITTDATAATSPYVYFTQATGTARTFYVDTFSMTLNANTTPNVQIGGGVSGGPTTLFTLDKGASAPIASNNDSLLGSMYYDTTLGKLQCYEAKGWGACGSSPDNVVTISPEYTNAVMHGTGIGTMTSDLCSGTLDINDGASGQPTICGNNETYNFYKWTSPQASAQTYSIYVTYQLPGTFNGFSSGQTSLMGRTDSANASVNYQIYKNDSNSGLTTCGSTVSVSSGSVSSWQTGTASGTADPSTCGFSPGNSIVFKINVTASSNASAYIGNLNFIFTNK